MGAGAAGEAGLFLSSRLPRGPPGQRAKRVLWPLSQWGALNTDSKTAGKGRLDTHGDKKESMDPDDITIPEMSVKMPNTNLPDNIPPASKEFVTLLRSDPSRRVTIRSEDTEVQLEKIYSDLSVHIDLKEGVQGTWHNLPHIWTWDRPNQNNGLPPPVIKGPP